MNIEIISGSSRNNSVSNRVAIFLQNELIKTTTHHIGIIDVREWNLPLLQNVFSSADNTPEEFKALAKRMFNAHAFIIVTPEYNGSYTPALKNLFDHFPKQSRKAFGIVTASPGIMGGMRASQQLQLFINALFGIASPHMLITAQVDKKFNENAELIDSNFKKSIDTFLQEYLWLAEQTVRKVEIENPLV